jgi:hypothetical protein
MVRVKPGQIWQIVQYHLWDPIGAINTQVGNKLIVATREIGSSISRSGTLRMWGWKFIDPSGQELWWSEHNLRRNCILLEDING